jgi:hypothetical protein
MKYAMLIYGATPSSDRPLFRRRSRSESTPTTKGSIGRPASPPGWLKARDPGGHTLLN